MAGETRLEHATDGFGDRCSTIELLPLELCKYTQIKRMCQCFFLKKNKKITVLQRLKNI